MEHTETATETFERCQQERPIADVTINELVTLVEEHAPDRASVNIGIKMSGISAKVVVTADYLMGYGHRYISVAQPVSALAKEMQSYKLSAVASKKVKNDNKNTDCP